MEREKIIAEIQRIARLLDSKSVSQSDFEKYGEFSLTAVTYNFGSWNRAVVAAGLEPYGKVNRKSQKSVNDDDLLGEIIRLTIALGKRPSDPEMASFGKFSPRPYANRWGTFAKARAAAYEKLGFPLSDTELLK